MLCELNKEAENFLQRVQNPLICQYAMIKMTQKGIANKRQLFSSAHEKIIVKMRLKCTRWDSVRGAMPVCNSICNLCFFETISFLKIQTNDFKISQSFIIVWVFSCSLDFLDQTVISSYLFIANLIYHTLY